MSFIIQLSNGDFEHTTIITRARACLTGGLPRRSVTARQSNESVVFAVTEFLRVTGIVSKRKYGEFQLLEVKSN